MQRTFTLDLKQIEKRSLELLEMYDEIDDNAFDDAQFSPSGKIINNILEYSKKTKSQHTNKRFQELHLN